MFRKLGTQIVVITAACIAVVVAVMLTVTLVSFDSYNDRILLSRAHSGISVLQDTLEDEVNILEKECMLMYKDEGFKSAVFSRNTQEPAKLYEQYHGSEPDLFCVITDSAGKIFFSTSAYPFTTFDFASFNSNEVPSGIVDRDNELAAMYVTSLPVNNEEFKFCIGFTMEASDWLENVKSTIGCDVTVYNGNICYATTK